MNQSAILDVLFDLMIDISPCYAGESGGKELLIAVGKATLNGKEMRKVKKGIVATPVRVVMETDSYPRMWKQKL